MANRQFFICVTIAVACLAVLGALGYEWFGVLGWTSLPGQIVYGLTGGALVVGVIVAYARQMPRQEFLMGVRTAPAGPPIPSWQERCAPIMEEEGLITCEHLFAIEAALREAGIRLYHPPPGGSRHIALADCWFHERTLKARFPFAATVTFVPYGGRYGDNDQSLNCSACHSGIRVFDTVAKRPCFPTPFVQA